MRRLSVYISRAPVVDDLQLALSDENVAIVRFENEVRRTTRWPGFHQPHDWRLVLQDANAPAFRYAVVIGHRRLGHTLAAHRRVNVFELMPRALPEQPAATTAIATSGQYFNRFNLSLALTKVWWTRT